MDKKKALELIWNYMHMNHELKEADAIFVLGSTDLNPAYRAAELFSAGFAPLVVCSGSGTTHTGHPIWDKKFGGRTEAEVYADILLESDVPESAIKIEKRSQNTGENFQFSRELLEDQGITLNRVIVVQKPAVERRIYATAKVWLPDVEVLVTSPQVSMQEYAALRADDGDYWIHSMVGDMQRIKEYPKLRYQIEQEIPDGVWEAFKYLVAEGYTDYLIK